MSRAWGDGILIPETMRRPSAERYLAVHTSLAQSGPNIGVSDRRALSKQVNDHEKADTGPRTREP